jgi:hypothetical protein
MRVNPFCFRALLIAYVRRVLRTTSYYGPGASNSNVQGPRIVLGLNVVVPAGGPLRGIPSRFVTVTDERPSTGAAIMSDQQPSSRFWGELPTPSS